MEWLGEHPKQDLFIKSGGSALPEKENISTNEMQNSITEKIVEKEPKISIRFTKDGGLSLTPRKPLLITLFITSPKDAKTASVVVMADRIDKKAKSEQVFRLGKLQVKEERAQTQFYWSAKKLNKLYVPRGKYKISAAVDFYDKDGKKILSLYQTPQPESKYIIDVN